MPPMITSSRPKARYSSSLAFTWAGVPQAAWRRTTSSLTSRSTSLQFSDGVGRRQRRLVEPGARRGGCSRHDGRRAARSRSAGGSDRCPLLGGAEPGVDDAELAERPAGRARLRPARCRPSRRAARSRPRSARRRSRGRRACSMLGREAAITIGTLRPPFARRRPETVEDLALEVGHLARQQRAADLHRLADGRPAAGAIRCRRP